MPFCRYTWGLAILPLYSAFFFVGCAQNNPTVSINPSWTEKPTKITVVFTEPFVDNVNDLEDDLEEYTEKFTDWYKAELKKNYDSLVHKSIDVDFRQVNIAGMSIEHDSVGTTEFNIPKPSTINMNEGYYIAISNAGFSRKEETYAYQFQMRASAAKKKHTPTKPIIIQIIYSVAHLILAT